MKTARIAAFAAAGMMLCTVPAAITCYADTSSDFDAFYSTYSDTWNDPYSGTAYFSNWSSAEGSGKQLYIRSDSPYAKLTFTTAKAGADPEAILAQCSTFFGEGFTADYVSLSTDVQQADGTVSSVDSWRFEIRDYGMRADTERRGLQLSDSLAEQYSMIDYKYTARTERFTQFLDLQHICEYFYTPENPEWGTQDPNTVQRLTEFVAGNYPGWEVQAAEADAFCCTVRKTGCDFYDVPIAEYLTVRSAVKNVLGYEDSRLTVVPEELLLQSETAVYSYPRAAASYEKGDITMDGKVDVDDVLAAMKLYTYAMVSDRALQNGSMTQEEAAAAVGFTPEQLALGNFDGLPYAFRTIWKGTPGSRTHVTEVAFEFPVSLDDVLYILRYVLVSSVGIEMTPEEVIMQYCSPLHLENLEAAARYEAQKTAAQ